MAPSRNTKRAAAAAPADEPAAKKVAATLKKHGVTQAAHKQMQEVVSQAVFLPEECRKMLSAMLPHSLCVASDLRQEIQSMAVSMMEEVLSKLVAQLQETLEAETQAVKGSEDMKTQLDEKLEAAEKALEQAQAHSSEQDSKLQESSEAVLAAKTELVKREEEQKVGDADLVATQSSKDEFDAAVAGDFQILKDGEWSDFDKAKQLFQSLEPMMGKLAMDESLKSAMQSVLLKKPAERGAFDSTVLEELDKCFGIKIAELTNILESGKPESEARAARVVEARASLEAAEVRQKECSNNVLAAKEAQKEAAASVKAAMAAVADYKPTFEAATQQRDQKQKELQNFLDVNMDGFTRLKDRLSAKKLKQLEAAKAEAEALAAQEAKAAEEVKAAEEAKTSEEAKAAEETTAPEAATIAEDAKPAEEANTADEEMTAAPEA